MALFKSMYDPLPKRPLASHDKLSSGFKDQFAVPTLLLLGSLIQILLSALLPAHYAFMPVLTLIPYALFPTIQTLLSPGANTYIANSIGHKTTALLPDSPGIVVLHLGIRFNHPLGVLAPGGKEMGRFFSGLNESLQNSAHEHGFLGVESYRGEARSSKNTQLSVYYFTDLASLRRFVDGPLHREAVTWWAAQSKAMRHIGIYHEVFYARRGEWETVYDNMPPTLLGSTHIPLEGGGFQSPLVDGEHRRLRTMKARMSNGEDSD
ncbi:hypothetical protein ACHAQA_006332 [Verticillium albo-atrum]